MSRDNVRPLTTRLKLFCLTYLLFINLPAAVVTAKYFVDINNFSCLNVIINAYIG